MFYCHDFSIKKCQSKISNYFLKCTYTSTYQLVIFVIHTTQKRGKGYFQNHVQLNKKTKKTGVRNCFSLYECLNYFIKCNSCFTQLVCSIKRSDLLLDKILQLFLCTRKIGLSIDQILLIILQLYFKREKMKCMLFVYSYVIKRIGKMLLTFSHSAEIFFHTNGYPLMLMNLMDSYV